MALLHILCESERDDVFYDLLCERITGTKFERESGIRLRRGESFNSAVKLARLFLSQVSHWEGKQDIAVLIAVDNDRAPGHPAATSYPRPLPKSDLKKEARYPRLQKMLNDSLGEDRTAWPVEVGIAIPIEMIESWLLALHCPSSKGLPIFSRANQRLPREYHGGNPPPQLKELRDDDAKQKGLNLDAYFLTAAECDLAAAASVSPSLGLFFEEVRSWRFCRSKPT